jgi:F-type H+-transporting ATPase subunit a
VNAVRISPDEAVLFRRGFVTVNLTLAATWMIMILLAAVSWSATRAYARGGASSRRLRVLETAVTVIADQIKGVGLSAPGKYLPFLGTLFLFIATANLLTIVPGYEPPTASLSTTAALAACVFLAVPAFGVSERGWKEYLRRFARPNPVMLPFNLLGELTRTLALAVRLFGNVMSESLVAAILLGVAPFFFPVLVKMLGLLTGMVQAYIFAILAAVYITAATQASEA